MEKKYITIIIILAVVGIGYYALTGNGGSREIAQETPLVESEESEANTVIYQGSGFTPEVITVDTGTTVTFINRSSKPMWVGSDPHPAHTDYPDFDQLRDGDEYSFTFNEEGSYPYHNHLFPSDTGMIIVE
jgi:plastocyanin